MPSICPLQHVERWTTITTTTTTATATALADWGTFCSLPLKRLMTFTRPTHNYSNNVTDSRLDWLATGQCCNRGNSPAADDISEVSGDNLTRRCRVAAALRCAALLHMREKDSPFVCLRMQQSSNSNNSKSKSTASSCYKAHSSRNEAAATTTRTTQTTTMTVATRACVGHHFVCF